MHGKTANKSACSYLALWAGPQRMYCCRQQLQALGPGSLLEPSDAESHWAGWGPLPSCWNSCHPSPRLHWWRGIAYTRLTRGQTFLKTCQLWSLFIAVGGTETKEYNFRNSKKYRFVQVFCYFHFCCCFKCRHICMWGITQHKCLDLKEAVFIRTD